MNNSFIKLLNDKGDIKIYKYMEITDSDPLHETNSYYEEYIYNVFDLLKENEQLRDEKVKLLSEKEHYKHLYSELKKQKDDVVELIYKKMRDVDIYGTQIFDLNEILRMLGETDDK